MESPPDPEPGPWAEWDRQFCWHPFTAQDDWTAPGSDPLVLTGGEGAWLIDAGGRRYLDGNSSIWTNIHGHRHPRIDAALREQLGRVAHTSFLGFTNPGAAELARRLVGFFPDSALERVFFSDDGSTAVEVAVKMAIQYRQQRGQGERTGFLAFDRGYHGDTMGASSLGGVSRFFERFRRFGFPVTHLAGMDDLFSLPDVMVETTAAVVIEPLIQGVNEMRPWPAGMLRDLRAWCDRTGVHLILDEVMTGFGRTGRMFACQHEEVVPDFLCLAKGLTGGYLPLAATLTTGDVYDAFLGGADRTFYYGHSYTANQLGCAAALASLEVFREEDVLGRLPATIAAFHAALDGLRHPWVHERRSCGLIAGIELRAPGGQPFPADRLIGEAVCREARAFGLLTRPIRDTIVLMPPLCVTADEIEHSVDALRQALASVAEGAS